MNILVIIILCILWSIALTAIVFFTINIFYASKGYRWVISDHFDGKRFYNIGWSPKESFRIERSEDKKGGLIYWLLHREKNKWKKREITPTIPVERNMSSEAIVTYIGHATVLIQIAGMNILTDPVWSHRASPFSWAGPRRFTDPGVKIEDLPEIDIILLSHNHYDHMDISTLRQLKAKDNPLIYTGLGNVRYLQDRKIENVIEMDWWQEIEHQKWEMNAKIIYLPAQHFSARGLTDRNKTLWWGFRMEVAGKSLYFAWDTGYGPFIDTIYEKYPEGFDIGLIPIGAYKPRWFMAPVHTDPFEGMKLQRELAIKKSLGIHYGTFDLADDNQDEPIEDLRKAKENEIYKNQIFEIGASGTSWNW